MRCGRGTGTLLGLLLLLAAGASLVRADDDWAQWGHDARRTGASTDRVKPPLVEVWSWEPLTGGSPLYGAAIWKGRIFYVNQIGIAVDPKTGRTWAARALVCANARTGEELWKRSLSAIELGSRAADVVAPVVGDDGQVFVYDAPTVPVLWGLSAQLKLNAIPSFNDRLIGPASYEAVFQFLTRLSQADAPSAAVLTALVNQFAVATEGEPFADTPLAPVPACRTVPGPGCYETFTEIQSRRGGGKGQPEESSYRRLSIFHREVRTLVIRTFSAADGRPGPARAILKCRITRPTPEMVLLHAPLESRLIPYTTEPQGAAGVDFSELLGPPLLVNGILTACTHSNRIIRWTPTPPGPQDGARHTEQYSVLQLRHPQTNADPNSILPTALSGFAPLEGPGGTVIATDAFNRFFATVNGDAAPRTWHLDVRHNVGRPASNGEWIFMPTGGAGASAGITAIHGLTGATGWVYPPEGIPADPPNAPRGNLEKNLRASHWSSPGLVLSGNLVYGEAGGTVVALSQESGQLRWRFPLPPHTGVHALAAGREQLFLCVSTMGGLRSPVWDAPLNSSSLLLALRLADGKPVWVARIARPGTLAVSGGLLYLMNGGLHAYAPAERTFGMAVDSAHPEDYRRQGPPGGEPAPVDPAEILNEPVSGTATGGGPVDAANPAAQAVPAANRRERAVADATVLRLRAGDSGTELLAAVRARRQALPGVPLLLSLDALDATRSRWTFAAADLPLTGLWIEAYVRLCRELAAAGQPEHFELLPEINVYLARNPDRFAAVRALAGAAVLAIHEASPNSRVGLSFNLEVLAGRYSRGDYRPFEALPQPLPADRAIAAELGRLGDEVGLTSYPQMAYVQSRELPGLYLTQMRRLFGERPVLLTRIGVRLSAKQSDGEAEQAAFLGRLLQNCYWQECALVCYPELLTDAVGEAAPPLAIRLPDRDRAALAVWQGVLHRERRSRLTVSAAYRLPGEEDKDGER